MKLKIRNADGEYEIDGDATVSNSENDNCYINDIAATAIEDADFGDEDDGDIRFCSVIELTLKKLTIPYTFKSFQQKCIETIDAME